MKKGLQDYIEKCESFKKNNITQITTKLPLELITTPDNIIAESKYCCGRTI